MQYETRADQLSEIRVRTQTSDIDRLRPPRVNAAGWCQWCDDHGCESDECVEKWLGSWWVVCTECAGRGYDEFTVERCTWCYSGLIEVDPPASAQLVGEVVALPPWEVLSAAA